MLTLGLVNLVVLFSRGSGGFADWLAGTRVVRLARLTAPARPAPGSGLVTSP